MSLTEKDSTPCSTFPDLDGVAPYMHVIRSARMRTCVVEVHDITFHRGGEHLSKAENILTRGPNQSLTFGGIV